MKDKLIKIMGIMILAGALVACGNSGSKVNQVIQSQMQAEDGKNNDSVILEDSEPVVLQVSEENEEANYAPPSELDGELNDISRETNDEVDVDLTKLSSTMVYSEVYNMMYAPNNYVGKTIKMSGMFVIYTNQDGTQYYPAVIIADATACCSQGLEFVLEENPSYPDGYPEMGTDITVVGTFETYREEDKLYCRLQNARIQ